MFNSVTLDFELNSNHTSNCILWKNRMRTIIFKKNWTTQKFIQWTCTTKGKGT